MECGSCHDSAGLEVVYSEEYTFPIPSFGSYQLRQIKRSLVMRGILAVQAGADSVLFVAPDVPLLNDLEIVHDPEYLRTLVRTATLAGILEVAWLRWLPLPRVRAVLMRPFLAAAGGTLRACESALERGAAANLFGGLHHAHPAHGHGFCPISDVAFALHRLWSGYPDLNVLVIDLDAHFGDGHAEFFVDERRVTVVDAFNENIFPGASASIDEVAYPVPLSSGCIDEDYRDAVYPVIERALGGQRYDLVVYIAGTCLATTTFSGQRQLYLPVAALV